MLVTGAGETAGSSRLVLVDGAVLLRPEPSVYEAMLAGRRLQQESRLLATPTVDSRDKTLRRLQEFTGDYPWRWRPADIEDRSVSLRSLELQAFFDYSDDRVAAARARGRKGGLAAWRDTAMFKVTYAWGLRRREAAMLDTTDFSTNPAAPELGRFGMLSVRWGKAMRDSPPRRRNVASVMPWSDRCMGRERPGRCG